MLINLTPIPTEIERRKEVAKEHNFKYTPQSEMLFETGIYGNHGQFSEHEFDEKLEDFQSFAPTYHKSQYGVCDNIEQVKEYYKEEIEDPVNQYVICLVPIYQERENMGKGGGWRWHKWGPYIGTLEPQCEYLDDEPKDIPYVLCFHLYQVIGKHEQQN